MEAAGVEDSSDRLGAPENAASAVDPASEELSDAGAEEALEEVKLDEEKLEEEEEVVVEENEDNHSPLGCLGLAAASCCVCIELEQVRNCVRSEKICILPILACLLSLALCTAGLKWVFVDKIFEYEPPTHLDPKPIGQDPIIINADPTMGLPMSISRPTSSRIPITITRPEVLVEGDSTAGPFAPASPKLAHFLPTSKVTTRLNPASQPASRTTAEPRRNTPSQHESNNIVTKTLPTSTTASAKTSSHMTRCKEEERSYCVNGGECLTVNVTPNSTKHLCRCPNEFTGDRCQNYVMASFYKAEELYQKQILTITGICIALLVVGIMCVVAYCKTKKQRQKLHDRLRQSLRKRNAAADAGNGPQYPGNLQQPPQSLQLVDQYTSKSAVPAQHVIEKETETSFTLSEYTSATQPSTAVTASLSQCWSHKHPENGVCETCVIPGVQNSTPSQRGRLNATGGARDINACVKTSRETTDSYKDSPYSERFVSTATTPTRFSPVKLLSPATPSSPPSEMSAALPSLATSIPSMATSPLGEEERPLLFLTPPRLREKSESSRAQQLRNSAHYNHGLDEMSPPPSPRRYQEDKGRQEDDLKARAQPASAPHSPTAATHNSKRTNAGSQNSQDEQSGSSSESSSSSSSSSESEAEEERMAEDTPFLIQNAGVAGMTVLGLELIDSSRTNSALHLSPQDDLQSRLASVMANQDPIAV